jgi:hypothetical protein
VATRKSKLTARRLVITFAPNDGLETGGLPSGGCGDLIAEREFPSDKAYRRNDRVSSGSSPSARRPWASSSSTPCLDVPPGPFAFDIGARPPAQAGGGAGNVD